MDFFYLAVLSVIQGITEFLPVSSQAHLILAAKLGSWQDLGPSIEVAAHLGSLVAIVCYFRTQVVELVKGMVDTLTRSSFAFSFAFRSQTSPPKFTLNPLQFTLNKSPEALLFQKVVVASIPVIIAGLLVKLGDIQHHIRTPEVIAVATILFGLLLWVADTNKGAKSLSQLSLTQAFWVGLFQCFALIPGASRSGVAMTMGRFCGLSPMATAQFSLLLAMPVLAGAVVLTAITEPQLAFSAQSLVVAGLSFVSSLVAVAAMLSWLRRAGFGVFVAYRLLLGLVLLVYL